MPSPRRDRLRGELQRLRNLAGLSGRKMAAQVGVTQATVSRIERGETLPSMPVVRAWLAATDVGEVGRERLLDLAEAVLAETRNWGELLGDVGHAQLDVQRRELDAHLIRNFQPTVIPGLLQTPEYARAVLSIGRTRDVVAAVAARIERQQVLYDMTRAFEFLISERVLRWPLGGEEVAAAQRDRLLSLARLATVKLAVLPADVTVAAAWHNFILWKPPDGAMYVTTELVHGAQEVHDPDGVALYVALWNRLWAAAAVGDDAVALIRDAGR